MLPIMYPALKHTSKYRCQHGYILLEGLIVTALLAVGILTMAGLQKTGVTLSHSSLLRSKATILAYEMADRVRANMPAQANGSYNLLTGSASNPGCVTTGCTSTQIAQNDYFEWISELGVELPAGTGAICLTSTPDIGTPASPACNGAGNIFAIKIWWTQKNENTGGVAGQAFFYTTFRP